MPFTTHQSRSHKTSYSLFIALLCGSALLLLPACQPNPTPSQTLPTIAVLPSLEPTQPTATPADTDTPAPTLEPSATMTATVAPSATSSRTPPPSSTPFPTLADTVTVTSSPAKPPVFSTLTPLPPGTLPPPGTPQQLADVTITRQEFQNEINQQTPNYPSIQEAIVEFTPDGFKVQLTALGGAAFIDGIVTVSIQVSNGLAAFTPTDITVNAPEPPDAYVDAVGSELLPMLIASLDTILKERLGAEQKLKNIVLSDENMLITLLVPE